MSVSLGLTYIYMYCTSSDTYIFELKHVGLDTIDHEVGKMTEAKVRIVGHRVFGIGN